MTFSIHTLAASAVIIVAALIHIRGVGPGRIASNVLTTLKIVSLVVFIAFGLTAGTGSPSNVTESAGTVTGTGLLFAFIPIMFTYSGWNAAFPHGGRDSRSGPQRTARALLMGTAIVIAVYVLINVLYLYVIPIGELATLGGRSILDVVGDRLARRARRRHHGNRRDHQPCRRHQRLDVCRPARLFRHGADNTFFKSAARVHPSTRRPPHRSRAQAILAIILVLTGSLDAIANYVGFAITLFAGTAVAAVFVLKREPNAPRPFKALGYPWTPAIFVLVSLAIVLNASIDPELSGWGTLIILAGIPLYYFFSRRK